jgi:hypothetical protein
MLFVGISERVADVTLLSQLGISKPHWNFGLIGIHISFLFLSRFSSLFPHPIKSL